MESKPIPRGAWSSKTCDTCKSSTALLFCRPHALFLCLPCDSTLHHAPPSHSPEHHAPPSHLPKAHSLFLCLPCDSTLHAPPSHSPEAHALFPCLPCDSTLHHAPEVHAPSSHSPEAHAPPYHAPEAHAPPHARVWLCEVCEHAPAMVSCKADNAAPLCRLRFGHPLGQPARPTAPPPPVTPFFRTPDAEFSLSGDDVAIPLGDDVAPGIGLGLGLVGNDDVAIANCPRWADGVAKREADLPCGDFLFCDADGFLDFDGNGMDRDSVVPVQSMRRYEEATTRQILNQLSSKYSAEIDFTNSKFNSIDDHSRSFVSHSFSQSISSSSMDVGVVPDGSSLSDMSYPYVRPCGTTGSIGTTVSQKSDREAKVMRYREKRKNRKFEKTIRYASRKAYAETRPRIKGRFAKRSVTEPESINEMFIPNSSAFMADIAGYGIVPSF